MAAYRLAVLADIHGNYPAFRAVMRDLERQAPLDAVLVAGDMVGGPGQQAILQELVEMNAVMIQGNGELRITRMAAGSAPQGYTTARQAALTRWVYEHLSPWQRALLCGLPEQTTFRLDGTHPLRLLHGSPRSANELVLPDPACHPNLYYDPVPLAEVIGLVTEPVIVFGHTHLPWQARIDGQLALNPGAVCAPENNFVGAQYAILNWDGGQWQPSFHQVPYDLQQLIDDFQQSGFLACSPLSRVLLASILTGKDYLPVYFGHVRRVGSAMGCEDSSCSPFFPDAVWDEAERTFAWSEIEVH